MRATKTARNGVLERHGCDRPAGEGVDTHKQVGQAAGAAAVLHGSWSKVLLRIGHALPTLLAGACQHPKVQGTAGSRRLNAGMAQGCIGHVQHPCCVDAATSGSAACGPAQVPWLLHAMHAFGTHGGEALGAPGRRSGCQLSWVVARMQMCKAGRMPLAAVSREQGAGGRKRAEERSCLLLLLHNGSSGRDAAWLRGPLTAGPAASQAVSQSLPDTAARRQCPVCPQLSRTAAWWQPWQGPPWPGKTRCPARRSARPPAAASAGGARRQVPVLFVAQQGFPQGGRAAAVAERRLLAPVLHSSRGGHSLAGEE